MARFNSPQQQKIRKIFKLDCLTHFDSPKYHEKMMKFLINYQNIKVLIFLSYILCRGSLKLDILIRGCDFLIYAYKINLIIDINQIIRNPVTLRLTFPRKKALKNGSLRRRQPLKMKMMGLVFFSNLTL